MKYIVEHLYQFFSDLQSKDWITLIASMSALFFSLLTYLQKSGESRLGLRKQLTDLLEKLSSLNTEISKFRYQQNKNDYPPNYVGLMNDQRRLLVKQSDFLASKVPKLVSPYEYLIMAGAFHGIDRTQLAEKYFKLAMSPKKNVDQGIAIRGYARFLFIEGRIEEARLNYETCLNHFKGDSDALASYRGDTYLRWAEQEKEWQNGENEKELLKRSYAEFKVLKNPRRKQFELNRIDKLITKPPVVDNSRIEEPADITSHEEDQPQ